MGVIYVIREAAKRGFWNGHPDWCNLGQGQPEVGEIEGAPPRLSSITLSPRDHAYGPIGGSDEVRDAVAAHYNRLYRAGRSSLYTRDNVTLASGGRLALTRVAAALRDGSLGYRVPDYTAYEDLLKAHRHRLRLVRIEAAEERGFALSADQLEQAITREGLHSFLHSNPCNPTGGVVMGEDLDAYCRVARNLDCAIVHDEFYSHFIYATDGTAGASGISAASYVEDVDSDPNLIVDGLTKNFRYPGWRVGWVLGPADMIDSINGAGSGLDGGPPQPMMRAALAALEPARADQETAALRRAFTRKRNLMLAGLHAMGIDCATPPLGTFYVWANVRNLPAPLNRAHSFFLAALDHKVIVVPGRFFSIDVEGSDGLRGLNLDAWVRFSFGPTEANVAMGLERLERMISKARNHAG